MNLDSKTKKNPQCLQNNAKPNKTTTGLITGIGLKMTQNSSGASGGSLHGGASLKVGKAHFAA